MSCSGVSAKEAVSLVSFSPNTSGSWLHLTTSDKATLSGLLRGDGEDSSVEVSKDKKMHKTGAALSLDSGQPWLSFYIFGANFQAGVTTHSNALDSSLAEHCLTRLQEDWPFMFSPSRLNRLLLFSQW